jgi:hypothetical protein
MGEGLANPEIEIQPIQSILIYAKSLNEKAQGEIAGGNRR